MEIFYVVLGSVALYAMIHFCVLSFTKKWKERGIYEKIVSIAGLVFITLIMIGVMAG